MNPIAETNNQPDLSANDSERLRGFTRMTAVEIKAVGGVGAATSLEMIGYIRELEQRLTTIRQEERRAAWADAVQIAKEEAFERRLAHTVYERLTEAAANETREDGDDG